MAQDRRSRLAIWIAAAQRLLMWHTMSRRLPLYLVTEYPKSGGSWVGQMLADYFQIPFPRDQRPRFETCIMHGHHMPSDHFHNVFCVLRDGRDIMVSYYFHTLFEHDRNNPKWVRRFRARMPFDDYDDIRKNLPAFIEYMFTEGSRGPTHFTWTEFVDGWTARDVPILRYEDLIVDAADVLAGAIEKVTGETPDRARLDEIREKYSFRAQAKREPGVENTRSFMRKGIAGDWKNHFSPEACKVFDRYAGDALIRVGYEPDRAWVEHEAGS